MNRDAGLRKVSIYLGLLLMLAAGKNTPAQDHKAPYPSMAPLCRASCQRDLCLPIRYQVLRVEGKSGFVCIVERSWMSPFDAPQFWNPKLRGPICFNPEAARSILPITYKRTELVLAGQSITEIKESIKAAFDKKQLPLLESGSMCYMMSKDGYLDASAGHWIPHLMFYTPLKVDWGADQPGSPIMLSQQFLGAPEPVTVFLIPAGKWSDGSTAPLM